MTEAPQFGEYRISAPRFKWVCVLFSAGMVSVVIQTAVDTGLSTLVKGLTDIAIAAAATLVLVWARRTATIMSRDCVTVRRLVRVTRIPWADIQDIRVERNPAAMGSADAPRELVAVYDSGGRRTTLPHMSQANLESQGHSLGVEVEQLRTAWMQLRGEQWVPERAVMNKIAERARYAFSPSMTGFLWAIAAELLAILLAVIGLFSGADGLAPPVSFVFSPGLILILPIAVYVISSVGTVIVRRRRQ
jgi:hypothetical protein